ncbi:MAG: hypothetical protein WA903_06950, partial [Ornithinimicrobium sp.]
RAVRGGDRRSAPLALLTLPGSDRVLAVHGPALPQPDQLCGPFSARLALHGILGEAEVPDLLTLATASGTALWPKDLSSSRPLNAPPDLTGWDDLPRAFSADMGGTEAVGLIAGLEATVGSLVGVVPILGADLTAYRLGQLLTSIAVAGRPVGVVANLRTGPITPVDPGWDVGHFVVLCGIDPEPQEVMVADTYAELTGPGLPPGCRKVTVAALAQALAAPPGRGLLLLVPISDESELRATVAGAGLTVATWTT